MDDGKNRRVKNGEKIEKLSKREKREAAELLIKFPMVFIVFVIVIFVCGAIWGYYSWETRKAQQEIQKQALEITRSMMLKNLEKEIDDAVKWKKLISECKDGLGKLKARILESKDEIPSWEEQIKRVDAISARADKLLDEYDGDIEQSRKMLGYLKKDILALIKGFESGRPIK